VFSEDITKQLEAKLDASKIKTRKQGGAQVSYIEAWHVIAEANRIFGFDRWHRETVYLKEVCRYEVVKKKDDKVIGSNWKVGYEAKVRITVPGFQQNTLVSVIREGTGYGQGTMGDLYDAMESAGKEAETDAMKRAFMTFGNQFGLALYDKEHTNVDYSEPEPKPWWNEAQVDVFLTGLDLAEDKAQLQDVWRQIGDMKYHTLPILIERAKLRNRVLTEQSVAA
jgi:DNA repair and recombination protein RAD52